MTGQSDNTLAMARQRIRHDDLIEIGMLNYDPMKAAYVKQCDALQDRIDALEKVLSCALNDNYWHELGCDSDPCTCWVAEARALLNK